jgi:hypothetical protein
MLCYVVGSTCVITWNVCGHQVNLAIDVNSKLSVLAVQQLKGLRELHVTSPYQVINAVAN